MNTLGRHLIAEFYDCDVVRLNDCATVEAAVRAAADAVGATTLQVVAHRFAPQGVTATAILAESHLSIHTWPEHGYAAADIFTCGDLDPRPGFTLLAQHLRAQQARMHVLLRGIDAHVEPHSIVRPEDVTRLSTLSPLESFANAPPSTED